jgi:hypothetical protein
LKLAICRLWKPFKPTANPENKINLQYGHYLRWQSLMDHKETVIQTIYFQDSTPPHIANQKSLPKIKLGQAFNNVYLLITALSKRWILLLRL